MGVIIKSLNFAFPAFPAFVVAVLAGLAFIAVYPLVTVDWFKSHELFDPLIRVFALAYEVENGDFYPRWLSLAYKGHGAPFFNYYSPGFYLISAYLYALGMPLLFSIKIVIWGLFFVGALGVFLWVKKYTTPAGALVAAMIYMYLPYHFVDLFVRGAVSEFAALAILPYLFYGIDGLFSRCSYKSVAIVALSSAAIVLTHNLSAFMIVPFAVLYFTAKVYQHRPPKKQLLIVCAAPLLGALISSFYWLPVLLEMGYIRPLASSVASGYYSYSNHFVFPAQWLDTAWGFGGSHPGIEDGMSFQLGVALIVFLLLGVISLFNAPKETKIFAALCFLLGMLALVFTLSLSGWLYDWLSIFQMVQFPWRYLGPATLFFAAFCGLSGYASKHKYFSPLVIVAALSVILITSSEQRSISEPLVLDVASIEANAVSQRQIAKVSINNEYLPKWSKGQVTSTLEPIVELPSAQLSDFKMAGTRMSFTVTLPNNVSQTRLVVPWHYFPGWRVMLNGNDTEVVANATGFLMFMVPVGTHQVEVYFGSTPPRMFGWGISVVGMMLLILLVGLLRRTEIRQGV